MFPTQRRSNDKHQCIIRQNAMSESSTPLLHPELVKVIAPKGLARIKSALWGNDPKDASLLIKLDFTILPYFSIIWFLFGLSRSSYATAYISGMKDDLH